MFRKALLAFGVLSLCATLNAADTSEVVEAPNAPTKAVKGIQVDIGLFRIRNTATVADYMTAERSGRKLEAEYRRLGLDVSVTAYVVESDCSTGLYGSCFDEIKQLGDHTHYHLWAGWSDTLCGQAWLGGNEAWTAIGCGDSTLIHEQGHNLSLHHSSTPDFEYGWRTWMGTGNRTDFAAQHAQHLGADVEQVQEAGTYLITSAYAPRRPPEINLVRLDELFVSVWDGRVVVSKGEGSRITLLSSLVVGEMAKIDGITVSFRSITEGVADVSVTKRHPEAAPAAPVAFQEFPFDHPDGLYSDPNATQQGVMVMGKTVYWMTWDHNLDPLWYWGQDGILYRADKQSGRVTVVEAGTYRMTSDLMSYFTEDLGRGEFQMVPITSPTRDPLVGHWELPGRRGLVLQAQGDSLYGFLLGYGEKASHFAPQGLQWHLVTGRIGGDLEVHEPRLGFPGVDLDPLVDHIETTRIENGIWMLDGSRLERIQ